MPLSPESSMFLRAQSARGLKPWTEMELSEARTTFRSLKSLFGPTDAVPKVEEIAHDDGFTMRLYHPSPGNEVPVLVYYHGGGWVIGDCDTHDSLCRQVCLFSKAAVLSVDYRLAPEHPYPTPLDDCYQSVKWVVDHGASHGLDAGKIAVGGDSAGGNLAAAVCLRARDEAGPKIGSQILIYPVIEPNFESASYQQYATGLNLTLESMQWFWDNYVPNEADRKHPWVTPSCAESLAGLPTSLTILAECDVLHDEGAKYAQMLSDAGVDSSVSEYDGMLHGFIQLGSVFERGIEGREEIARFVRRTVGKKT